MFWKITSENEIDRLPTIYNHIETCRAEANMELELVIDTKEKKKHNHLQLQRKKDHSILCGSAMTNIFIVTIISYRRMNIDLIISSK